MKTRVLLLLFCLFLLSGCNVLTRRDKTGLQVMTNDVPSTVFINDQFIEKTPIIDKTLSPGEYELRIVPDDESLVPYETIIVLRKGLLTVVTWKPGKTTDTSGGVIYEMEPLKNKDASEISFITKPEGVILTLDGGEKQFSPKIYTDLQPGNHTFEATLPSYETQNHTINVVKGYRMIVKITLSKSYNKNFPSPGPDMKIATESATITASNSATASTSTNLSKGAKILSTNYFIDNKEVLKVRQKPDSSSPEIGTVEVGTIYQIVEEDDEWLNISMTARTRGWISKRYAEIIK